MKRVLICTRMPHGTSYVGGIVTIIEQYLQNKALFSKYGINIDLFDYSNQIIDSIRNKKVHNLLFAFFQKRQLVKEIGKEYSDVVHIHSSRGWLLLKDLFLCKYLKRKTKSQNIITIHFADADKILYANKLIRNLEITYLNRYVDRIILLSKKTKKELTKLGIDENKIRVLYTFHSFDNPIMRQEESHNNLLYVGSIDKRKGIIDLLKVLVEIKDTIPFKLHICGQITENDIAQTYDKLIKELGDRVIDHGYISGAQKQRIFENADILILPSYAEGMPIVIMEAIATGTVIVSTKVGAIPEIVSNNNGMLFNPGDLDALKTIIQTLLFDKTLLSNIQYNNYSMRTQFSINKNISELCDIYNNM